MRAARTPNLTRAASARPRKRAALDWNAKLRPNLEPDIVIDRRHCDRLLLPTPLLVAAEIQLVPPGATLRMSELRARLARRFGADRTCPLMTGMFAKIVAGAVAEDLAQRRKPRWPVWRLVSDDGRLATTWPLDALYRATRLREEGVRLGRKAGAWQVLAATPAPA
jgi:hypothetical protein